MSGTMYSSLRYLLPAQASGEEWSSRLAWMEMRGWCGDTLGGATEGKGWIGEGWEYRMLWRGIWANVSGSCSGTDIILCMAFTVIKLGYSTGITN